MAEVAANVCKDGSEVSTIIIPIKILLNCLTRLLPGPVGKELCRHGSVIWETLSNKLLE